MSRRFLLACLLLAPAAARALSPASERTYTLDDAVKLAVLNNVRVLTAEQGIVIAQERVKEARFLFYPDFGFQANATRFSADRPFALSPDFGSLLLFPNTVPGIPTSQNLYSARGFAAYTLYAGGRHIKTLDLAKAALDQAKTDYEAAKMDVVADTKRVFARLLGAQKRAQEVDAALAEASSVNPERLSPWEAVEAEGLLARLRGLSSNIQQELEAARLEFLKGLNLELDTSVKLAGELEPKPVDVDPERARLWAIELRPELRSQVFKAQIDAIQVNLAQSRRIPTVVLGADYEVDDQSFLQTTQKNYDVTLGVRVPFSYTFWTELKQKRAEQRQGQLQRAELQDQVRLEVTKAVQSLDYWRKAVQDRKKELDVLETLYERARKSGPSANGMLRGRLELLNAKLAYIEAVQEHETSKAQVVRAVGREL